MMPKSAPTTENGTQERVTLSLLPIPTSPHTTFSNSHLLRQVPFLPSRTSDDHIPRPTSPFFFSPLRGRMDGAPSTGGQISKGSWTPDEDRRLIMLVKKYDDGTRNISWTKIAKMIGNRIGRQCRERWHNHLRPDIKKDDWSKEEELLFVVSHRKFGSRWSKLSKLIPGRSENSIKNHWNSTKRHLIAKLNKPGRLFSNRNGHSVLHDYILSIIDPSHNPPPPSSLSPPPEEEEMQASVDSNEYNGGSPVLVPPVSSYDFQDKLVQYRCPNCFFTLLPQKLTGETATTTRRFSL